jgi:hypothetical protein
MATLTIGDRQVEVDDGFLALSPADQSKAVEEIAGSLGAASQSSPSDPYVADAKAVFDRVRSAGQDPSAGRARQFLQGASFGTADEILAAASTPLEMIRRGTWSPVEGYNSAKAQENLALEEGRAKNGMTGSAAEIVGNVMTGGNLIGAGMTAIPRLGIVGGTAADAAAQGAALGLAEGSGLSDRLSGAALGGAAGAVAGPLALGAGRVAGSGAQWAGDRLRTLANPGKQAEKLVAKAYENVDPAAIQALFARNPEAALIDAGGTGSRDLLRAGTNVSPAAHETAEGFLTGRAARESEGLLGALTSAGDDLSTRQAQGAVRRGAQGANSGLYGRAFAEAPVVEDAGLTAFSQSPVGRDAIKDAMARVDRQYAGRVIVDPNLVRPPSPFRVDADGVPQRVEGVSTGLEFWNEVKKSVDGMWNAARVDPAKRQLASELNDIRRTLVGKLDSLSPSYAQARGAAAESLGAESAVEAGEKAAKGLGDGRDVTSLLGALSRGQKDEYAQGVVGQLQRMVRDGERDALEGGTRSIANKIFTPERSRRVAQALTPDLPPTREAAERLTGVTNAVDDWKSFADSRRALGNSTTARQQAMMSALVGGAPIAGSAYMNSGLPSPEAAALGALLAGGKYFSNAQRAKVGEEVVKMLTSRGAPPSAAALRGMSPEIKSLLEIIMQRAVPLEASRATYENAR